MSLPTKRSNPARKEPPFRDCLGAALLAVTSLLVMFAPSALHAAEQQHCVRAEIVLWGDGRHDDTAALNAWFRGRDAIWAASGEPVGATIAGHAFRLSAALYVSGGSGRSLEDFRMVWPERGETVAGGAIRSGNDPASEPMISGVSIAGGDPGEGVAFDAPDPASSFDNDASCAIS